MQKIDLARAKLHLRVDGDEEDALIGGWIAAAYLAIEGKIFAKLYEDQAGIPEGGVGVVIDEAIHTAAQLITGHLYANREAQADRPLSPNKTADSLLAMCRDYKGYVQ